MNIRYQIFVSSTYLDLLAQRKHVIDELIKVGYIAIGMEHFPASDEEQMDYICPVIDESDYYIVILKGKYGRPTEDGLSYTEKEFNYAVSKGKPALAFIYKDYESLKLNETEQQPEILEKFVTFKEGLMRNKIVRFWGSEQELSGAVKDSLMDVARRKPSVGWVRGDNAIDPKIFSQIESLRTENNELKTQIHKLKEKIEFPDHISHGRDELICPYKVFQKKTAQSEKMQIKEAALKSTWDSMLNFLRERIYLEIEEDDVGASIVSFLRSSEDVSEHQTIEIEKGFARKLRFQYEALGLIETFLRKDEAGRVSGISLASPRYGVLGTRSRLCWRFSEFGKRYVARVNAIQRETSSQAETLT